MNKRKVFVFWFHTAWLALAVFRGSAQPISGAAGQTAVSNALVHQSLRLPEIRVHDPWILAYAPSKTYYLYTSNNRRVTDVDRPGTMVYRSKDLLNWEGPFVVFALPEGTWAANQPAWAPEVHEYKGRFYLLTTLHNPQTVIAAPPEVWSHKLYARHGHCVESIAGRSLHSRKNKRTSSTR